ncbi:MAG: tetratricopeptide repeat protein [Armatimonadota bacterium]
MKICNECGARNADHSFLCIQCGKPLSAGDTPGDQTAGEDTDQIPPQRELSPEELVSEATERLGDGDAAGAAALCDQALAENDDYLPAFAILGMAHQEMGDLESALSAYENVLRIDPSRSVERRKANMIKRELMRAESDREAVSSPQSKWVRYGPIVLAIAAALLVFVVGAYLIVGSNRAAEKQVAQQTYEEAMEVGTAALDDERYGEAVAYFQQALQMQPGDARAQQGLSEAREMLRSTETRTATVPRYRGGQGPNPFKPVVIPADNGDDDTSAAGTEPLPVPEPTTSTSRRTPPRSVYRDMQGSSRGDSTSSQQQDGRGGQSASTNDRAGSEPISPVRTQEPTESEDRPQTAEQPPEKESPGEIRIWASDRPSDSDRATSQQSQSGQDAEALRTKADRLRQQGNTGQAAEYYDRAINAYRERMNSQPAMSESAQKAIESCQMGKELCETE